MPNLIKPQTKSLLEKIWPSIQQEVTCNLLQTASTETIEIQTDSPPTHRLTKRLPLTWRNPTKEVTLVDAYARHQKSPGFYLSQNNAKHIGTLTHQILEQISRFGKAWWQKEPALQDSYLRQHLLMLGMLSIDIFHARKMIHQSINNILQDERGQWILQQHEEAQSELALTALIDQEIKSLVIDRTFVEKGIRWIIDYKTTSAPDENIEKFLKTEQDEYAEQMQKYYMAIREMDNRPIRLGLYFPLMSAWQEWQITE